LFDAGAIEAKLTVSLSEFSRDMDKAEARVRKFEREGHHIRLDASFDEASIGKARRIFATLDNAISRDAMNRLRSSPQGSVLGTLNALFSPHPVTGAPSPQQSAQGGLLGKMITSSGGGTAEGGSLPGGTGGNGNANGDQTNLVRDVLTSNQQTTDLIKQQLEGAGPKNVTTEDDIRQALVGKAPGDVDTTDLINQKLAGTGASDVDTTDTIKQKVVGSGPGNVATTDTVREKLDKSSTDLVESASRDSGDRAGGRWTIGFGEHLGPFFLMFHKKMSDAGGDGGSALDKGLIGGIGPGILGIGTLFAVKFIGGIGTILAALPALMGVVGLGMGVAMVGGLVFGAVKTSPKLMAQLKGIGADATKMFTQAVAPLVPFLKQVFDQIPPLIKAIEPVLQGISKIVGPQLMGILNGLAPIIGGLLSIMQAAAPAFGPFIEALERLVGSLLPGIATVIKATVPFVSQLSGILATLGANLGGLFAAAAPAIGASMKVLGDLLGVIGGLLPVVMKLADVFATTLAPVFGDFGTAITALAPVLQLVGQVVAALAGAIIGDLAGAFGALASLIKAIGPSLGTLAKSLSSLFAILENSGVFAEFGDALENLAPALGRLIALMITDLVPILPPLIGLFSEMLTIIVQIASDGLTLLIKALTAVLQAIPPAALDVLVGGFIALKLAMMGFEGFGAIFGGIAAMITTLSAALDFDTIALKAMYAWDVVVAVATKAWAVAQAILDAVLDANPIVLIIVAVAALGVAIYELVTHWNTAWTAVRKAAEDAWNFIWNGFGKYLLPLLGPAGLIALGVIELYQHWQTIWTAIYTTFDTVTHDIAATARAVFGDIAAFFTGWWDQETASFRNMVTMIKNALATAWDDVFATVRSAWGNIIAYFEGIPGRAVAALKGLGPDLLFVGEWAIGELLAGAKSGASTMVSWLEGFAKDVVNVFKTIWGWFSPSTVMYAGGKSLMDGLAAGVKDHAHKALAQVQSVAGKVTAGVAQWTGLVQQALRMEGLSLGLTRNVLYQMQTESGGNAAAINLTDSNAKAGDPSRGLMQVIGSTFAEYHWPGTSGNIYDPLANIAAALNYARNVYGPTLMNNGMGIGSGHGYAMGGLIPEPVLGWGARSGDRYSFAEHAPEWVTPGGQAPGGPGVTAMLSKLDDLITATRRIPAGVGDSVGGAIGGASMAASFRSRYPRGGA
jgi:SLT domain-containing protein